MNDLLRKANELVEAIENMWADERMSVDGREEVCEVIKGYQELVRRMSVLLNSSRKYIINDDLDEFINEILAEAMASIPREQRDE